jgi:hypothetical protein
VQPAPVIRLVVRDRDSHRGAPRFMRADRWVAVAATVLCGAALTTLLEIRGAPTRRAIVGDAAQTTAAAPVLAAREFGVGTATLVPPRIVRSRIVAARIHAATDSNTRLTRALDSNHRSVTVASKRDTPQAPKLTRTAQVAPTSALPLVPATPAAPVAAAPAALTGTATALPAAATSSPHRVEAADARNAPVESAPNGNVTASRDDERVIYRVLEQYERAYERLDVRAAHAVWPSLNTRALARAFDGLKEQALEFSHCRVAIAPREATAICGGRASYVPRVGHQIAHREPREWTFSLRKVDQEWLIAKAVVR